MIGDAVRTGIRYFLIAVLLFLVFKHTDTVFALAERGLDAAGGAADGIARFASRLR